MSQDKWYHGRLSRHKAEELVIKAGIDGSFVVRASESILGAYALSVLHGGTIHTYRILPTENGLLAVQTINGVQQRKFTSITELITAYRSLQNGLVCGLTNPVGPASDKLTLVPPPPVATPMPTKNDALGRISQSSSTSRPAVPPPNFPAPQPQGVHSRAGVRVLPQQRDRELPPVPLPPQREAPQRPSLVRTVSATPQLPQPSVPVTSNSTSRVSNESVVADIKEKLQRRVETIVTSCPSVGSSFLEQLEQYCADGAKRDIDDILNGSRQCAEMQKLLAKEAGQFEEQLELFLVKIGVLRQLFDVQSTVTPPSPLRTDRDVDLESFLTRLGDCKRAVKNLDQRISITIKEQAGMEVESMYGTALRKSSTLSTQSIPEFNFEVKTEGGLKQTRAKLQVNIDLGRLMIIKGEDAAQFRHDQVLQIIKNNKSQTKLSVVLEGGKKREYSFEASSQREAFCQVMQHVRNMHSDNTEPDFVSVFIGTWNMGDAMPPVDIRSWFCCGGSGRTLDRSVCNFSHDIYVIGTQETGMPEKEWLHKVTETIMEITGERFHLVAMDALWHIKILILVKEEHKNRISHVQTSSVKTGIANALGNKGAVAVAFQFGGTSMCFINTHLTSGNEKCARRNNNYHDIMRLLNLGHDRYSVFDLTNRFDHLFFFGDLNYRLEMEVQEILSRIKNHDLGMLYKVDQLRREKELNKVFYGFREDEIQFPPTYRYERGTREAYSHLKIKRTGIRINVPSWCDRVLWKSYPETHNVCLAYGCCDDIMTSDHSPVFCNMQIGVRGQYVSNKGIKPGNKMSSQPATIIFESIEAILKSSGKTAFYLQFQSTCLPSSVRTVPNTKYDTTGLGTNCIRMFWTNLPQLQPIISDREYLVDQHLLVLVKSEDDGDTLAEFVLALRSMISTTPQKFQELLTRKGEDAGQIQGSMHVKTRDSTTNRKEKTYEFIQFGGKKEEVEPVLYTDSSDTSMARSSLLGNVGPSIVNAVSKISAVTSKIGSSLQPKSGAKAAASQGRARTNVDSRPPMAAPTGLSSMQSTVFSDTLQRSAPSGESSPSPQGVSQTSPVFPTRPTSDPTAFDSTLSVPPLPFNRNSSPSILDAVIAEFEAAGDMFESMGAETKHSSNPPQNYEAAGRTLPPPSSPAPTLASSSSSYSSSSLNRPRTVIGQPPTSPTLAPLTIGQTTVPAFPPPSRPAPQLHSRNKSVKLSGNTNPVMSVEELMSRLGLSQYVNALLKNGWDSLEFLSDILEEDLVNCGVVNPDHRMAILSCIASMEWIEQ